MDCVVYPWIGLSQFCGAQNSILNRPVFEVNTGCREQDLCQLRWDWEVKLPELDTCWVRISIQAAAGS